jgi:outer membrane protein TolC
MRMMKCTKLLLLILVGSLYSLGASGQDLLTKEQAVKLALENNLGIKLAQNTSGVALNNTSVYNLGKLPVVTLNGSYNYRLDNTTANFQDGRTASLDFAPSQAANASVNASYTLFDGYMRRYNTQQFQERYELSLLEVEATMENIAAQTLSQYYQIASLSENQSIIEEGMKISAERLERASQQFEYGQGTKLAVLNAQVDLNNDSLNFFNNNLQIYNAKRTLNNLLVDMESVDYTLDPNADFIANWSKEELKEKVINQNLAVSQIDKNIEIGNISIDLANARKLPVVGTNLSYAYSYNKNNSASFLASANNNGLNAGLTLSWNIFDGGTTRHSLEQARLNNLGLALERERVIENLEMEFDNAWASYENMLFIYETQLKNVEISRSNFERSSERFKIGQINSVDFRQAQINLLNAETVLTTSKYQVKIAEIQLLLLSGEILE